MWTCYVFVLGGELRGNWERDFSTLGEAELWRELLFATDPTVYAVEIHKAGCD